MGIKFFCPNGHKVNVKSFLAGKKGLCPKCGVRVDIPFESVVEKTGSSTNGDASDDSDELVEQVTAVARPAAAHAAGAIPDDGMDLDPLALDERPGSGFAASSGLTVRGANDVNAAHLATNGNGGAGRDMFGEPKAEDFLLPPGTQVAPQRTSGTVWHVQFSTGQQLGPLDDAVLQQWLGEGRIGPDDLLWREGWSQWQTAQAVFPHWRGQQGSAQGGLVQAIGVDDPLQEAVQSSQQAPATNWVQYRHRGKREIRARLSLVLLGLVVVLFALLLYVFAVRDQGSQDKSAGSTPTSTTPTDKTPAPAGGPRDPAASMLAPTR